MKDSYKLSKLETRRIDVLMQRAEWLYNAKHKKEVYYNILKVAKKSKIFGDN